MQQSRVAVFGVGGVGGFVVEALARIGISQIDVIDKDVISESNLNRQIIATTKNIGKEKVEVIKERILDINPDCKVNAYKCFYLPETKDKFDFTKYDYIVDAVDTVKAKLQLIEQAKECGTRIISCMGAGNKLDPTKFEIADIEKTSVCPLARVMRRECRARNLRDVKVLYSKEMPIKTSSDVPGSVSFVPSVAGLIIASEVVKDLISDPLSDN